MRMGFLRSPRLKRLGYVALCLVGAGMAVFWLAWIFPVQRAMEYHLVAGEGANSPTWWQSQHWRARLWWRHDDYEGIGENGSKRDVPWIVAIGAPGPMFNGPAEGHKTTALTLITNHTPGETKEAWEQWWKTHQHESQAEWILKGFADYGVKVDLPLPRETALELLNIIGRGMWARWKEPQGEDIPEHIRFNALRLLRDVEFDPGSVTSAELSADSSGKLLKGLLEYKSWNDAHPVRNGVGVVFGDDAGAKIQNTNWAYPFVVVLWWGVALLCVQKGLRGWRQSSTAEQVAA